MVVPVEEYERLLSQDDKHGVSKLRKLREYEQPGPHPCHPVHLDETEKP